MIGLANLGCFICGVPWSGGHITTTSEKLPARRHWNLIKVVTGARPYRVSKPHKKENLAFIMFGGVIDLALSNFLLESSSF